MAVSFPHGINNAVLNAPDLGELCPTPPPPTPLPIPYPNTAHSAAPPALEVINGLFGEDIVVVGINSDLFVV